MNRSPRSLAVRGVAIVLALASVSCHADGAGRTDLSAGIASLRARAVSLGEAASPLVAEIDRAESEARAKRRLASLALLESPWVDVGAQLYSRDRAGVASTLEGFEREWREAGDRLAAGERRLMAERADQLPAAVRALVEVARARSRAYHVSGRLYAQNTTAKNGLYYVGVAGAELDYALFLSALSFERSKPAPKIPALSAEIARLETSTVAGYTAASDEQRGGFVGANVALKEAADLDRGGEREGALYTTLEAARALGRRAATTEPATVAELEAEAERWARKLEAEPVDLSIGTLFVELARSRLQAATPAQIADAAVVLRTVLPKYAEIVGGNAGAPREETASVTVTLVRWPYT
jgi:hypothetical protein